MNQYSRLNFNEREEISRQLAIGISMRAIATSLNRSPSTVLREITFNQSITQSVLKVLSINSLVAVFSLR